MQTVRYRVAYSSVEVDLYSSVQTCFHGYRMTVVNLWIALQERQENGYAISFLSHTPSYSCMYIGGIWSQIP